jgi:co-chaperonin GroES (HSP10)
MEEKRNATMQEMKESEQWTHESIFEPENLALVPDPTGYRMIVVPYAIPEFVGSQKIILARETREKERLHATVHRIVKMGPECYTDPDKFPDGKYAEVGDYVLLSRYCGSKFNMRQCDVLHVINDDEVLATTADPESILTFAK